MQRKSSVLLIVALNFIPLILRCQELPRIGVFVSNNITSMPVSGFPKVFYSQFHPGINVCREWKINKKEKEQIWLTANAGGFYHRFVQTAVRLYATVEYRYAFGNRFSAFFGLGGGYVHSFENSETLRMNDEGVYEVKPRISGRPQFMVQADLGGSCALIKNNPASARIIMLLQTGVQGPFVNGYVPLLPVNSFSIGLTVPLKCRKNE